jgi:hypothetical protein
MGDSQFRGDIWKFVQQIGQYKTYDEVLRAVDTQLQLGIRSGSPVTYSPVVQWVQPKAVEKPPPLIQVVTRKFTKEELHYWEEYYQGLDDLMREKIYAPKEIYVNRKRIPKGEMAFCYFFEEIERWKVYRPYAERRTKDTPVERWKWMGNVPFDYLEGKWNIAGCDTAILTKSRKDSLVLKKALSLECVCNVQAEDPACLSDDTIEFIKMNSQRQVAVMDADKKGKEFSWWLTREHGFKHCNVPEVYREEGIKDFADMAKRYTPEVVKQHFISKKIII